MDGRLVERLAPEAVIARLIKGTASSMRTNNLRIACTIRLSSISCCALFEAFELSLRSNSSALAADASRCPRFWISQRRDLVRETADSRDVLPRAELTLIRVFDNSII